VPPAVWHGCRPHHPPILAPYAAARRRLPGGLTGGMGKQKEAKMAAVTLDRVNKAYSNGPGPMPLSHMSPVGRRADAK